MRGGKLTSRQERFCAEYVKDLNATRAYQRAFANQNRHAASVRGAELLRNATVRQRLRALPEDILRRCWVDACKVLQGLARIGFCDPAEFFDEHNQLRPLRGLPQRARQALASFKVKRQMEKTPEGWRPVEVIEVRFGNKVEALDRLARYLGLLQGRGEDNGDAGQQRPPLTEAQRLAAVMAIFGRLLGRLGGVRSGNPGDGPPPGDADPEPPPGTVGEQPSR